MALATHFAPAERLGPSEVHDQVEKLAHHALVEGLLGAVDGMLAVLNEQRQILAVNERLLESQGVPNAGVLLGLRPGEALRCRFSHDTEGGCGTGPLCSTCGAAISIVAAVAGNPPVERDCALSIERNGATTELCLRVRAVPVTVEGTRLILLFLQDVTAATWRASLERVFFHDVNNTLAGLLGAAQLLEPDVPAERGLVEQIRECSRRLVREVEIQRVLSRSEPTGLTLKTRDVSAFALATTLCASFSTHPVAAGRRVRVREPMPERTVRTDPTLLERVLVNMITNALEASAAGAEVTLSAVEEDGGICFGVWNEGIIPEETRKRLFQRHFSTKGGAGRGFGTHSMKLFGERFLRGRVGFTSSQAEGTTFRLWIPWVPPAF